MTYHIRGLLGLSLALACLARAGAEEAAAKPAFFKGKVAAAKKVKGGLELAGDDGKAHPLVEDDGSRMLFKEASLRGRAVRLTGQLGEDGRLTVTAVQTYVKGQLHDAYYWCEKCQLAYSGPGKCACCGAAVELKEVAVTEKTARPTLLQPL